MNSNTVRVIVAVVAGFLIAGLMGYGVEYINAKFWLPPDVNWFSMEDMKAAIPNLPPYAALPNLIGGMVGLYLGARVAGKIARNGSMVPGYLVTALILIQGIIPQFIVEEPLWMIALGSILMFTAGYLGTKAGSKVTT